MFRVPSFHQSNSLDVVALTDFQRRQAPHLRKLWNIEFGDNDSAASLSPYRLRTLYVSNPALRKSSGTFLSGAITHMLDLELLSLRSYTHLELDSVPTSVHTLQVGPARIVKDLSHK